MIRLGDLRQRSNVPLKPAYLACGTLDWCARMIRQSKELSDTTDKYERVRWLILEQEQVGAAFKDPRGVLAATIVNLPNGMILGGLPGSHAEILSACSSCLMQPIAEDKINEIVKNDDD